MDYNTYCMACW